MHLRSGVSNILFGSAVIVLLVVAGLGFGLYLTKPSPASTTTEAMMESTSEAVSHTTTAMAEMSNGTTALQFTPVTGQMIHNAWLLIEPAGMGEYALSIHAEGLESTQSMGGAYIVEAVMSSGSMAMAPIGPTNSASEFEADANGAGNFFILLHQNPYLTLESVQIVYLPAMEMANATVAASASLPAVAR